MKKTYHNPTTEVIVLNTTQSLMQASDPDVGIGAGSTGAEGVESRRRGGWSDDDE